MLQENHFTSVNVTVDKKRKRTMTEALRPSTPASAGATGIRSVLAGSLDARWEKYLSELTRCKARCSEKSVHDLRVATRRLQASLDLVMTVLPDDQLVTIRGVLKKDLQAFNPLRDEQVKLLFVKKMTPGFPALEPFQTILMLREQRLVEQIGKRIRKVQAEPIDRHLQQIKKRLLAVIGRTDLTGVWLAAVLGAAAATYARAVDRRLAVNPTQSSTVHEFRVAFKKFRYIVEVLQPILPDVTRNQLRAMNAYQVRMGDIQDIEVLRASINAYAATKQGNARRSLVPVQQELDRRHAMLIDAFLQSADDLYAFWALQ
jgi:CHAD domain-containing protein